MSTAQIDIIRSLVKGAPVKGAPVKNALVKGSLSKGFHARRVTHAAATQTTPATTTDVEPTVNQVSDLVEQEPDGVSSAAKGSGKEILGTTTPATTPDVEPTVNQVSDQLGEERDGVSSGAKGSGKETLGTTGVSELDMIVESIHPSTKEQSEASTNGANDTGEQSAVQQEFATVGEMLSEMLGCIINDYPLVAGFKTLFDVVRAWYTGAFANSSVFPTLVPTGLWFRLIVRFGIGFVLVKYRKHVERYMNHIRIALAARCLCVLVGDVVSGNFRWETIFTTGIAVPLLMYQAVVQKEAGGMVVMLG